MFFSSIRVDPGPTNRGHTSLLALKIITPVANTGKLRSIGQMSVIQSSLSFPVYLQHDIVMYYDSLRPDFVTNVDL